MSLTTALNIAQTGIATAAAQSSVISRNIAGINNPSYSLKTAVVTTLFGGGSAVTSINRAADQALFANLLGAKADAAAQQVISDGLTQLQQTVGDTSSTQSPASLLASLSSALQTYSGSPSDPSAASAAVTAAKQLAASLNNASTTVQQARGTADADIASTVADINSLLGQFQTVNDAIVNGTASGADVTDLEDTRGSLLNKLSQDIGITTVAGPNNSVSIYTDSGVTLFEGTPRSVAFQPTASFSASTTGNAVVIDGVPVTGSSAVMPIRSGKLAGLANLRDNVTVQYQSQLDEIARGLINAFAESDQTGSGAPTVPGLFTYSGGPAMPASGINPGLAAQIKVSPNVDPTQGGNVNLLRDGGISNPGSATYTYNKTSAAGYTDRINQLIDNLSQTISFNQTANADASDTLAGYASASVSWLEAARQDATNQLNYKNAVVSQSSTALSNVTGVNLDTEMSKMLDIEHSYQASAELINSINSMFGALFQAIQ